jgi:hypothetical protein
MVRDLTIRTAELRSDEEGPLLDARYFRGPMRFHAHSDPRYSGALRSCPGPLTTP